MKLMTGLILAATMMVGSAHAASKDKGAWRAPDPENTLYIDTEYGLIIVEMAPDFAPQHVERMKSLAKERFYDFLTFHRVIDGFMAQGGDPKGDGTGQSDKPNLPGEFILRRLPSQDFEVIGQEPVNPRKPSLGKASVGFYKGFRIASQPDAQSSLSKDGKVDSWLLHCPGTASMARSASPDSANAQFFLMRGEGPWLNQQYTAWGQVIWGQEHVKALKTGTIGQDENFKPDIIKSVRLASELPEKDRLALEIMRTDSEAFKAHLEKSREENGGQLPDICKIEVPVRLADGG